MSYVRDMSTGLVINNDDSHYKSILTMREQRKQAQSLYNEIDTLKSELSEIKALMQKVIDGKNYG